MRAHLERYAAIGFCGGTGACVVAATLQGQSLLLPLVIGSVIGTATGAVYAVLRTRLAS